jgi:carboxyl-terminal processing protease
LKYGVIYLPKFYIDFENKDGREMLENIALEVETQSGKVDGIVMFVMMEEVHYHGSWISLDFHRASPYVQIKSAGRKKEVYSIEIKKLNGMVLVIMVNSFSSFRNFSCCNSRL